MVMYQRNPYQIHLCRPAIGAWWHHSSTTTIDKAIEWARRYELMGLGKHNDEIYDVRVYYIGSGTSGERECVYETPGVQPSEIQSSAPITVSHMYPEWVGTRVGKLTGTMHASLARTQSIIRAMNRGTSYEQILPMLVVMKEEMDAALAEEKRLERLGPDQFTH